WDFLPVNPAEIKQVEAVRGPGSAVWGANAMTGVVNLITKRPREMVGTSVLVGGGELGTRYGSVTNAGANDHFGSKISGGYYEQTPTERPGAQTGGGVPPPPPPSPTPSPNSGTKQPRGDRRLDWHLPPDSPSPAAGGSAGTAGIVHTGIGPFDVDTGSHLS